MQIQSTMIDRFKKYLSSRNIVSPKQIPYYVHWVRQFHQNLDHPHHQDSHHTDIEKILKKIEKFKEPWQVDQAREAIQIFTFFIDRDSSSKPTTDQNIEKIWQCTMDRMVKAIRLRQLSLRTEKTYLYWLRSFSQFFKDQSPYDLKGGHLKNYLTFLAADVRHG
ncbi:phage integrase N-terminal SAM-like domain-containing protein [uncultured Desulfosarcina sp.]|uniref:phage integrase N-terminal SAM-like domain-containing protein n=1 Tax=uncultured Desulfosarcina sp. TaxID=218289 RepID=UPI0029C8702F|nr:phage integrase N-terminal SAM-like domain-containing protein [uncultured Desulfosarcina sp.]